MTKQFETIRHSFSSHADEQKAEGMSKYMRGHFVFFGIPTPLRRSLSKGFIREFKNREKIDWDVLTMCYEAHEREMHYLALDALLAIRKKLLHEHLPKLFPFIKQHQWWDSIDVLDGIVGEIARKDVRTKRILQDWATDEDIWLRRIAINHQLEYKEETDIELLEYVITENFGSDEFFINKAIGWSLREYSKTNPEWVRDFLNRHRGRLSPLSLREAGKYL